MSFWIIWFLIWYTKPAGCFDTYMNERTQCGITFPDHTGEAYGLCIDLAENRLFRCWRGEPYNNDNTQEIP